LPAVLSKKSVPPSVQFDRRKVSRFFFRIVPLFTSTLLDLLQPSRPPSTTPPLNHRPQTITRSVQTDVRTHQTRYVVPRQLEHLFQRSIASTPNPPIQTTLSETHTEPPNDSTLQATFGRQRRRRQQQRRQQRRHRQRRHRQRRQRRRRHNDNTTTTTTTTAITITTSALRHKLKVGSAVRRPSARRELLTVTVTVTVREI